MMSLYHAALDDGIKGHQEIIPRLADEALYARRHFWSMLVLDLCHSRHVSVGELEGCKPSRATHT